MWVYLATQFDIKFFQDESPEFRKSSDISFTSTEIVIIVINYHKRVIPKNVASPKSGGSLKWWSPGIIYMFLGFSAINHLYQWVPPFMETPIELPENSRSRPSRLRFGAHDLHALRAAKLAAGGRGRRRPRWRCGGCCDLWILNKRGQILMRIFGDRERD